MGAHENNLGETDERYTPPEMMKMINEYYDLDPCSPGKDHWIPARYVFTKEDDSLNKKRFGFVFMNPPFGGRNGVVPWLEKFIEHGNGIGISRAYTSSWWFQKYIKHMDCVLFPDGKTNFFRPDGSIGRQPGTGVVLFAIGERGVNALKNSKIGLCYKEIDNES